MDCIFCKVTTGELPSKKHFEDDSILVIEDISPQAPVHLLVMPKSHVPDIMSADTSLIAHVMQTVQHIIRSEKITKYRLITNGPGAQLVEHLHIHIMGGVEKERKL